jgi:hypothetical protein
VRNAAFTWLGRNRQPAIVIMEDLQAAERLAPPDARDAGRPSALIAKSQTAKLGRDRGTADAVPRTLVLREIHGLNYREISAATAGADRHRDVAPRPRAGAPALLTEGAVKSRSMPAGARTPNRRRTSGPRRRSRRQRCARSMRAHGRGRSLGRDDGVRGRGRAS